MSLDSTAVWSHEMDPGELIPLTLETKEGERRAREMFADEQTERLITPETDIPFPRDRATIRAFQRKLAEYRGRYAEKTATAEKTSSRYKIEILEHFLLNGGVTKQELLNLHHYDTDFNEQQFDAAFALLKGYAEHPDKRDISDEGFKTTKFAVIRAECRMEKIINNKLVIGLPEDTQVLNLLQANLKGWQLRYNSDHVRHTQGVIDNPMAEEKLFIQVEVIKDILLEGRANYVTIISKIQKEFGEDNFQRKEMQDEFLKTFATMPFYVKHLREMIEQRKQAALKLKK